MFWIQNCETKRICQYKLGLKHWISNLDYINLFGICLCFLLVETLDKRVVCSFSLSFWNYLIKYFLGIWFLYCVFFLCWNLLVLSSVHFFFRFLLKIWHSLVSIYLMCSSYGCFCLVLGMSNRFHWITFSYCSSSSCPW